MTGTTITATETTKEEYSTDIIRMDALDKMTQHQKKMDSDDAEKNTRN